MSALSIIEAAAADGLVVDLSSTGGLKVVGDEQVIARWAPTLKQHKAEIVSLFSEKPGGATEAVRPLPEWCRLGCPGMEAVPLPGEGKVLGCVDPRAATWTRLDWLQGCPADDRVPKASLPEFCRGGTCKRFHKLPVPGLGVMQWCCEDTDKTHWRRERINTMTGCPKKEESEP